MLVEKRKHVLWLQWLLVLAIAYLLYFNQPAEGSNPAAIISLAIVNTALNVGLFFLPSKYFQSSLIDSVVVVLNILMVSLAIYLTGQATSDFYLFFFIILMMAATGQNLKNFVIGVVVTSGLYILVVYRTGDFTVTTGFLLRVPFLFIVGLFFGYIVYLQTLGEKRARAESEFTGDLFEFGKALVQTEDLKTLYSRIPGLIDEIMTSHGCELALVSGTKITQRVFQHVKPFEVAPVEMNESIHQKTYESDEIHMSANMDTESELAEKMDYHLYPYRHYLGKSWKVDGRSAGLIAVYRKGKEGWSAHDIKKFQFLTDQTVLALQHVYLLKDLETQARTDGLTGLANYRYFSERIEEEFSRALRQSSPLSLMLMDIDHFKTVNDTHGHDVGDEILRRFSLALRQTTRHVDLPARRGGDEFVVLLPDTDADEGRGLCTRLIEHVEAIDSDQVPEFSISVGCATFPLNGTTISELLEHADEALYFAKAQGRGCAWHYSEIEAAS